MRPPRVLIVERDARHASMISLQLSAAGFAPLTATGAVSALVTARRERPSVIVFDLARAPHGLERTLSAIREIPGLERVPAIALFGTLDQMECAAGAGFDRFVPALPDGEDLVLTLSRVLGLFPRPADRRRVRWAER